LACSDNEAVPLFQTRLAISRDLSPDDAGGIAERAKENAAFKTAHALFFAFLTVCAVLF
jgi:hypothetical protein